MPFDLEAEITVNPREGAGSSVPDKVEFYKESDGGVTEGWRRDLGRGRQPGSARAGLRRAYR
jgi:hypothetical protein